MMAQKNPLTEKIRPYADRLMAEAESGGELAQKVIKLYQMYAVCPADHGAPALCESAFDEWLAARDKD